MTIDPASHVSLPKLLTIALQPAQASFFPVTVRMNREVAATKAGKIVYRHFEVRDPERLSTMPVRELSTFIVPR